MAIKRSLALTIGAAALTVGIVFGGAAPANAAILTGSLACPSFKQGRLAFTTSLPGGVTWANGTTGVTKQVQVRNGGPQAIYAPWSGPVSYWLSNNSALGNGTFTGFSASCA